MTHLWWKPAISTIKKIVSCSWSIESSLLRKITSLKKEIYEYNKKTKKTITLNALNSIDLAKNVIHKKCYSPKNFPPNKSAHHCVRSIHHCVWTWNEQNEMRSIDCLRHKMEWMHIVWCFFFLITISFIFYLRI